MATDRATLARAAYDAYGRADRAAFEALAADGFRFWSPQDDGIDRAAFFERCWPAGERSTFRIVRLMTDGDEAMITYEATRRGIPAVVLDPSGPLARLTHMPELRGHSEHLDLTTAASGTLNPFEVVAEPLQSAYPNAEAYAEAQVLAAQDRKLLAIDVVKMLLPPSLDAIPSTSLVHRSW